MTDALVPVGDGHTALTEDERTGLRLTYIVTRGELNDAEQRNITLALNRRPPQGPVLLDDAYLRRLHAAMFGQVWRWAGKYRVRETNIGVDPAHIPAEVRNLVGDARTWVELGTYPLDELAIRFHHRLVYVHPFPNGNGRHARLAADYLARALGGHAFSWGASEETSTDALRSAYLEALRAADQGIIESLVAFARS